MLDTSLKKTYNQNVDFGEYFRSTSYIAMALNLLNVFLPLHALVIALPLATNHWDSEIIHVCVTLVPTGGDEQDPINVLVVQIEPLIGR